MSKDNDHNDVKDIKIDREKDTNVMIAAQSIMAIIKRNDKRVDPKLRQLLFIDKLLSILDVTMSGYISITNDVSDNTKNEAKKAVKMIREKFEELEDYIESQCDPNLTMNNTVSAPVPKIVDDL